MPNLSCAAAKLIRFKLVIWLLWLLFMFGASVWFGTELFYQIRRDHDLSLLEAMVNRKPTSEELAWLGKPVSRSLIFSRPHPECRMIHMLAETEYHSGRVYYGDEGVIVAVSRPERHRGERVGGIRLGPYNIFTERTDKGPSVIFPYLLRRLIPLAWGSVVGLILCGMMCASARCLRGQSVH